MIFAFEWAYFLDVKNVRNVLMICGCPTIFTGNLPMSACLYLPFLSYLFFLCHNYRIIWSGSLIKYFGQKRKYLNNGTAGSV